MRNIIVKKVGKEISKGITTEAQALYILVEIRKVIKGYDNGDRLGIS